MSDTHGALAGDRTTTGPPSSAAAPPLPPPPPPLAPAAGAPRTNAVCPVPSCGEGVRRFEEGPATVVAHLQAKHLLSEVPAAVVADLNLAPCPHCGRGYRNVRGRRGLTSLVAHAAQCRQNPRRRRARAARLLPTPAPRPAGAAAPAGAASPSAPTEGTERYLTTPAEWLTAREAFLSRVTPDEASWPFLVASGARTLQHVPAALLRAWRLLGAEALEWVRTDPARPQTWLWLLLLPSLLLHEPCPPHPGAPPAPQPTRAERAALMVDGSFSAALDARNAGIWRPAARAPPPPAPPPSAAAPAPPPPPPPSPSRPG